MQTISLTSKTTKSLAQIILVFAGLLNLPEVSAEPRYYDIEVIIFDDANEKYLRSEHWPQKPETETAYPIITPLSKPETAGDTATNESNIFQAIEPAILTSEAKRISASRHYHLLFYSAWTQEGLDSEHAININLEQLNNHADVRTKNTITGELKVVLARYLHFYSNLEYTRENKVRSVERVAMNNESDNTPANDGNRRNQEDNKLSNLEQLEVQTEEQVMVDYYPISNHRRMRSKVLHYIDHPLVGILVQINPVKKTDASSPSKSQ